MSPTQAILYILLVSRHPGLLATPSLQEKSDEQIDLKINGGARWTRDRNVLLTIHAVLEGTSAVEMTLSADGKSWAPWRPLAETTKFELPEGDGEKKVFLKALSRSGRESRIVFASITLDTVPPEARFSVLPLTGTTRILILSDVKDAVAMQFTENPELWGEWEPYAKPKEWTFPDGPKGRTIFGRYRDEAGNVSAPLSVQVDLDKPDAPSPSTVKVRDVGIQRVELAGGVLDVHLRIDAPGMARMHLRLDGQDLGEDEEVEASRLLRLSPTGGSHRLGIQFRDDAGREEIAELAFEEAEVLRSLRQEPMAEAEEYSARVGVGAWDARMSFRSLTSKGPRELKPGALGTAQLALGWDVEPPLFFEIRGEYAFGSEASAWILEPAVGVQLFRGELIFPDVALSVSAAPLLSHLATEVSNFGGFDTAIGFALGANARVALARRWSLDLGVDFRDLKYKFSGKVLSGNTRATSVGPAVSLGISLAF